MAFVIRFEDFGGKVGYWNGKEADTNKNFAKLYKDKKTAESDLVKIRIKRGISVKIIQDIWNRARKNSIKQNPQAEKKIVECFQGRKLKKSDLTDKGAKVGRVSLIRYLAVEDGKTYEFEHKFSAKKLPELIVEKGGKQLRISKNFIFKSSGINDK